MASHDEQLSDDHREERSPWSKPSVMLSGMFVLALLVAGVAVLIFHDDNGRNDARAPATTKPATPISTATATPAPSSGGCTLPAGSQRIPFTAPPDGTSWQQVGSMQTPQAPSTLGPERTKGVWNACFAHNPSGALLAAFNFWAQSTAAASGDVYRRLAVDVPSVAYKTRSRLDDGGPVQFAGYRYQSYSSSTARLMVVIRGPRGALEAAGTSMRWTGTDWRYAFPPQGVPALETIPDLAGYVTWSAF